MENQIKRLVDSAWKIFNRSIILFLVYSASLFAQEKISKGLELIENDRKDGLLTAEEALVQKFYYGFNKSGLDNKYYFENDIPGKCGTAILEEYRQNKNKLSQSAITKIESCRRILMKAAFSELKYISPSGNFELTYTTEGDDAVSDVDIDSSGVPDYVERIAGYLDYSWSFVVDTLGYLPPPIGDGKYQVKFEAMGWWGYTDILDPEGRLTYIAIRSSFDDCPDNMDPEGSAIGYAKVVSIHEFMHACQHVYDQWNVPHWFRELHATWVEDIGYDYVNEYYSYLSQSQIINPSRSLNSSDGYSDCIFMHCLTQKFGNQISREIWERIGLYSWEASLYSIDGILKNYNSSLSKILPEYFSWCYLTGENADSRLPSFKEAENYPTSQINKEISTFPYNIEASEQDELSANFLNFFVNETTGNLSIDVKSYYYKNPLVLIVYFKDNSVDIKYYSRVFSVLMDTEYKLEDISNFIIIPVNTNLLVKYPYSLFIDKYRGVFFSHTPFGNTEDISPKTITANIRTADFNADLDNLKLNYKFGNGTFQTLPLSITEDWDESSYTYECSAEISGISDGDIISYYFSYYDSLRNSENTLPITAPDSLFSFMCGVDNIAPTLSHRAITSLTKYDFPRRLFADISDNYNVASAFVEYNLNDKEMKRMNFVKYRDSVYYAPLFMDTTYCNDNDKISYRIIVSDSAVSNNTVIYPNDGFINVVINRGFKYESDFDYYWLTDTLYVKEDFPIKDLNVCLKAKTVMVDSILITLTSPSGKVVELKNIDSLNCDSLSVVFDDSAELDFTPNNFFIPGNNYITGHYRPDNDCLNEFNGFSAKGEWILQINDLSLNNYHVFKKWGLILQTDQNISAINEQNENSIANEYFLSQNYPNPFNPSTTIKYSIPAIGSPLLGGAGGGLVSLKVYDLLGREVATVVNEQQQPGYYEVQFDGSKLASGIYFYKMQTGSYSSTKKLMLLK